MCILWGQSVCKWCRVNHRSHWRTTDLDITGPLRMRLVMTALIASASHALTSSSLTYFARIRWLHLNLKKIVWFYAEFSCLFSTNEPHSWCWTVGCLWEGCFVLIWESTFFLEQLQWEINKKTLPAFVNVIGSNHLNSHHISETLCLVLHSQGHCVAEQQWIQWALSRPVSDIRDVC